MDNIIVKKYIHDPDLIGLDITVESKYLRINQIAMLISFN